MRSHVFIDLLAFPLTQPHPTRRYSDKIQPDLGQVLRKIRAVHTALFQGVPPIVADAVEAAATACEDEIAAMSSELNKSEEETGQLLEAAEMLESEAKVHQQEMLKLKKHIRKLESENSRLKEVRAREAKRARAKRSERERSEPPQPGDRAKRWSEGG